MLDGKENLIHEPFNSSTPFPFLCHLYREVATYRDHFSIVCLSLTKFVWTTKLFHPNLQEGSVPSLVGYNVGIFRFEKSTEFSVIGQTSTFVNEETLKTIP
jgi:hypothetical protein